MKENQRPSAGMYFIVASTDAPIPKERFKMRNAVSHEQPSVTMPDWRKLYAAAKPIKPLVPFLAQYLGTAYNAVPRLMKTHHVRKGHRFS
jgi:hypothetical protein